MADILKKIVASAVSEIVEGAIFGLCLYLTYLLPDDAVRQSIINSIIILWVVAGIGTPLMIFTKLEHLFEGNGGRS